MKRDKPGSRWRLLTPKNEEALLNDIRLGLTYTEACQRLGIGRRTFYDWRTRGEAALDAVYEQLPEGATDEEAGWDTIEPLIPETERPYAQLVAKLATANIEGKRTAVAAVRKGMTHDWRAAAWYLERKYPNEYSRQATSHVNIEGRIKSVAIDPTDREKLDELLAAATEVRLGTETEDDET